MNVFGKIVYLDKESLEAKALVRYSEQLTAAGAIITTEPAEAEYLFHGRIKYIDRRDLYGYDGIPFDEVALLDTLSNAGLNRDRLPLDRLEYYANLPSRPEESPTVFMYEVRRMAQELMSRRESVSSEPKKVTNSGISGATPDPLSARRWEALLRTPALRLLGYAGLRDGQENENGYAHFGMEAWSVHASRLDSSEDSEHTREKLTRFADTIIANEARYSDQVINLKVQGEKNTRERYEIRGEGISVELPELEGDAIFNAPLDERLALGTTSVRSRGISTNVTITHYVSVS